MVDQVALGLHPPLVAVVAEPGAVHQLQHYPQALPVHLDPASLEQHQTGVGVEQLGKLLRAQRLVPEHGLDPKIQECLPAEALLAAVADAHRHLGAAAPAPPVGQAHHQPALLVERHLAQEAVGLLGRPGQRVVDVAAVHQLLDPRTQLGGPLHRRQ